MKGLVRGSEQSGARSRNLFLGYWNIGAGQNQLRIVGVTVWRSRRAFTAQLGMGAPVTAKGELEHRVGDVPVLLLYSIGVCRTI